VMMDDGVLSRDGRTLLEAFLLDAAERMQAFLESRVILETHPADRDAWDQVRRAGHTIAGNAAMMGFEALAYVARGVERRAKVLVEQGRGELGDVLVLDGEYASLERLITTIAIDVPGRRAAS